MSSKRKPNQIDLTTNKLAAAFEQAAAPKVETKKLVKDGATAKNIVNIGNTDEKKPAAKIVAKKAVKEKATKPAVEEKKVKVAIKTEVKPKAKSVAKKKVATKKKAVTKAIAKKKVVVQKATAKKSPAKKPIKKVVSKKAAIKPVASKQIAKKTPKKVEVKKVAKKTEKPIVKKPVAAKSNLQNNDLAAVFEQQNKFAMQAFEQGMQQIQYANKVWTESVNNILKSFTAK